MLIVRYLVSLRNLELYIVDRKKREGGERDILTSIIIVCIEAFTLLDIIF